MSLFCYLPVLLNGKSSVFKTVPVGKSSSLRFLLFQLTVIRYALLVVKISAFTP